MGWHSYRLRASERAGKAVVFASAFRRGAQGLLLPHKGEGWSVFLMGGNDGNENGGIMRALRTEALLRSIYRLLRVEENDV
ncbi:hypothetical protein QA633_07130 [Bradyrhizobium barranii]|uniref:hypothetical protein n=1 Tax=Bradyrhizobium barranii TaxID=2992140 RepID=UPI0024B067E5|nr:hypothetical protein [Bradyrhizobium barranii]WFT96851.1 hypothetical protein QA633_07130 [Bradyrhizobium barranii]